MADKEKTEAASDEENRSETSRHDESQTPDEQIAGPTEDETDAAAPEGGEPEAAEPPDAEEIEDAEVIGEILPERPAGEMPTEPEATYGNASDHDSASLSEPWGEPDPDTPADEEDIADLRALDGEAETVEPDNAGEPVEAPLEEPDSAPEPAPEPEPEPRQPEQASIGTITAVEKEPIVIERRGGMVGGFVGGVLATLGLAFAAPFVLPENVMPDFGAKAVKQDLAVQAERVAALEGELENVRTAVSEAAPAGDLAALGSRTEETFGSLQSSLETVSASVDEVRASVDDVRNEAAPAAGLEEARAALQSLQDERQTLLQRISELEKRPIAEATDPASIAAVEAYGREVAALRQEVDQVMGRAEAMVSEASAAAEDAVAAAAAKSQEAIDAATAKSDEALAEAEAQTRAAAEEARRVARASALVDVQAALDSGQPFQEALARLDGVDVAPELASQAEAGVPTLGAVQEAFAPAARAALHASRKVTEAESVEGRLATFLRSQTGIRSLTPREGDDPDAVLSRAQAAAEEARLEDAIAEISALPEAGQEQMADWVEMARLRAGAVAAADALAASLETN